MIFKATDDEVRQIMANAVNASTPAGIGFFQARPGDKPKEEIVIHGVAPERVVSADYYEGRMVKLTIRERAGGEWEVVYPREPRIDYQSWAGKYQSIAALVGSVVSA